MQNLFGKESIGAIAPLLSNLEGLEKNLSMVADASQYAGSMQGEFDTKATTTANQLALMKNKFVAVETDVGNGMIPAFKSMLDIISPLAAAFGNFASKNSELVGTAFVVGGSVAALGAGFNALAWAGNGLVLAYNGIKGAMISAHTWIIKNELATKLATGATKAWTIAKLIGITLMQTGNNLWQLATGKITLMTAKQNILTVAQWAFNSALLACPVMWLVAGLAAVVAAGYLLYKNWDDVTKFGSQAWEWFCNNVIYGVGYMIGWFATIPERVTSYFNNLDVVGESFGEKAWNWGKLAVDNIVNWFLNMPDRIGNIISSMWNRIKLGFNAGMVTAESEVQVAHNALGGIYGKGAFLTTFAEDSGESAIPHTPNARNIGLLAETNRIMGNPLGGGANITATFAPNITIQGGGDEGKIREVLELEMAKFKKMLQDLQNQQRRVSYA